MRINYRWISVGILIISMWVAFSGLSVIPLESHEVYVIQTAQEMSARNEWVVPFCYGKPRLNKPPMSYWYTMAVGKLLRASKFKPFHGRSVSAVSGVLLVGLTMYIGWMLFGRSIGVLSGVLLTSTISFANYTHNARPEMLYTMLCTASFAFFLQAWRGSRFTKGASYGMWASMGMATLTKGPHIPAILFFTFVLILLFHSSGRQKMLIILRPYTGILVFFLIAAPWWIAVYHRVGPEIFKLSQLAGSRYRFKLLDFLDPYYFYRSWSLLLPWIILWPSMVVILFNRFARTSGVRFLAKMILVPVIILSFGHYKRWYYMLPFMAPACIWMALAARHVFFHNKFPQIMRQWIVTAHFIMAVIITISLWVISSYNNYPEINDGIMAGSIFLLIMIYATILYIRRSETTSVFVKKRMDVFLVALFFAILSGMISLTGIGHSARFNTLKMVDTIQENIGADMPILSYRATPEVLAYYTNRKILDVNRLAKIRAELQKAPDKEIAIVTEDKVVPSLEEDMFVSQIATIKNCAHKENWTLLIVRSPP